MFYKLPEEKGENCETKILKFIEHQLKVDNAEAEIKLHRAHRIGTYSNDKVRPIVAKFVYYPDRERVRKSARELKGTQYGIGEQFPPEILDIRRKLVPIMKKAKEDGHDAYININKLYIDNHLYTGKIN